MNLAVFAQAGAGGGDSLFLCIMILFSAMAVLVYEDILSKQARSK